MFGERGDLPDWACEVIRQTDVASLPQHAGPQLHTHDAENEEHEEAEHEHVAQHGQSVQQQHHQDTHTWRGVVLPSYTREYNTNMGTSYGHQIWE